MLQLRGTYRGEKKRKLMTIHILYSTDVLLTLLHIGLICLISLAPKIAHPLINNFGNLKIIILTIFHFQRHLNICCKEKGKSQSSVIQPEESPGTEAYDPGMFHFRTHIVKVKVLSCMCTCTHGRDGREIPISSSIWESSMSQMT